MAGTDPSGSTSPTDLVMAGLVPATHAAPFRVAPPCGPHPLRRPPRRRPAWMPGTSPGMRAEGERRGGSRWRRPAVPGAYPRDVRHGRACPGHPRRAVPRRAAGRSSPAPSPALPPPGVGARDKPGPDGGGGGARWRFSVAETDPSESTCPQSRHGRACPGHPRRAVPRRAAVRPSPAPSPSPPPPGVGARDKPGHDGGGGARGRCSMAERRFSVAETGPSESTCPQSRHGRACPGHPRRAVPRRAAVWPSPAPSPSLPPPGVGARDKPGHDGGGSERAVLGGGDGPFREHIPHRSRHGRACPGHPRRAIPRRAAVRPRPLRRPRCRRPAWVPGTSPVRTAEGERKGGARWRRQTLPEAHPPPIPSWPGLSRPPTPRRPTPRRRAASPVPSPSSPPPGVGARDRPGHDGGAGAERRCSVAGTGSRESTSPRFPSGPGLSRPPTPRRTASPVPSPSLPPPGVGGRDRPGHDGGGGAQRKCSVAGTDPSGSTPPRSRQDRACPGHPRRAVLRRAAVRPRPLRRPPRRRPAWVPGTSPGRTAVGDVDDLLPRSRTNPLPGQGPTPACAAAMPPAAGYGARLRAPDRAARRGARPPGRARRGRAAGQNGWYW